MTGKTDLSATDWKAILQGPPSAGLIVITAQRGGTIRETFSMAEAYAEARRRPGQSQLIDEIVTAKPELDRTRSGSPEEVKDRSIGHLRDAVGVLEAKATPQELDDYRHFVLALAQKVASAHREGSSGEGPVSDAEQAAIDDITRVLGADSATPSS
jgi:hypothetical protein